MLFKAMRLACVLVVMGWAAGAAAQTAKYSLSGQGGYWIGGGMPVPVTKGSPPNSALKATKFATVTQPTTGPDPRPMQIRPGQLTKPLGNNYAGQFPNNPNLMMVSTNLSMKFPAAPGVGSPAAPGTVTLQAGGRTGPATLTWCPGWAATNPPTCTNPNTKGIAGMLTYKKTAAQFGGVAQAQLGGKATIWAVAGTSPPPCKHAAFGGAGTQCRAIVAYASVAPLVAAGGPFGYANATTPVQKPMNVYYVSANSNGTIGSRLPVATVPFVNSATSYGGPWTTGQVTIQQTAAAAAPETFTLTGSDARVAGIGNISLVSGAVSQRAASGPNANRGWLNLSVSLKVPPVPSISSWGIASLAFLLLGIAAAGMEMARRKK